MDAGIGAARADRGQRRAGEFRQCALDCVLHRLAARLRLPAAKRGAVILQPEREFWHEDPGA